MRKWINLFEYRVNQVEWYGKSIHFHRNPTLSTIVGLTNRCDLRGVSDGKNFFVFDAADVTHFDAAEAVALAHQWEGQSSPTKKLEGGLINAPDYNRAYSVYFYNEETAANAKWKEEWYGLEAEDAWGVVHYEIAPNLIVGMNQGQRVYQALMAVPVFARLMRNAQPKSYKPESNPEPTHISQGLLDAFERHFGPGPQND